MSIEKQIYFIEKKYNELVKSAEMFQRDEIIERCVCKRSIRRNNSLAASKSARKCLELHHKSRVYAVMGHRIKNVLDFINNAVTTSQLNKVNGMKSLLSNIERSLAIMSFDLLDLYLDSFEKTFRNDKQKVETSKYSSLKKDSFQIEDGKIIEAASVTSEISTDRNKFDVKEKLAKDGKQSDKGIRSSFESSLKMYKLVPDIEVDQLVAQLAEEVKVEEVAFLFKTTKK